MENTDFKVNPAATLNVRFVGREQTPIIVIDDFALDHTQLIECACKSVNYGPDDSSSYPGIRGKLPRSYVRSVLNSIFQLLFKAYKVPEHYAMRPVNSVFSLISTPESELSPAQCVPHFDNVEAYYLAVLHYLNPGDFCDTGFFRHRPTGFERINVENRQQFFDASLQFLQSKGQPPQAYIKASNDHFELYDRVEYKPNRLVAYPGNMLHSGLVKPDRDINPDPSSGRLTANIFVNFSEEKSA